MQWDNGCECAMTQASPGPERNPLHALSLCVVEPVPGNGTAGITRPPSGACRVDGNCCERAVGLQREVAEVTGPKEPFAP